LGQRAVVGTDLLDEFAKGVVGVGPQTLVGIGQAALLAANGVGDGNLVAQGVAGPHEVADAVVGLGEGGAVGVDGLRKLPTRVGPAHAQPAQMVPGADFEAVVFAPERHFGDPCPIAQICATPDEHGPVHDVALDGPLPVAAPFWSGRVVDDPVRAVLGNLQANGVVSDGGAAPAAVIAFGQLGDLAAKRVEMHLGARAHLDAVAVARRGLHVEGADQVDDDGCAFDHRLVAVLRLELARFVHHVGRQGVEGGLAQAAGRYRRAHARHMLGERGRFVGPLLDPWPAKGIKLPAGHKAVGTLQIGHLAEAGVVALDFRLVQRVGRGAFVGARRRSFRDVRGGRVVGNGRKRAGDYAFLRSIAAGARGGLDAIAVNGVECVDFLETLGRTGLDPLDRHLSGLGVVLELDRTDHRLGERTGPGIEGEQSP